MCGIIGIVGIDGKNVANNIISGLEKLEYRGYDSAGIAVVCDRRIEKLRAVGKLQNLKTKLEGNPISGSVGIGHTRWATHGKPTENNAHPITSEGVAVVHNGIIENYRELKFDLQKDGFIFETETDTEVIAHLLQREINNGCSLCKAFQKVLDLIEGSYAIAAIFSSFPNTLVAARHKSPLAVGFGEKHICVGSDVSAMSAVCCDVIYLEDGEWVKIADGNATFFDKNSNPIEPVKQKISDDLISIEKGEYAHYMLKEIMEQPSAIRKTILYNKIDKEIFHDISRILILACGTSYYAGMVAKYWFEKFLKIPVDVEIASEYRYRSPIIGKNTLAIAITQSGETIDTLEALEYVRKNSNSRVVAIANVKNSAISRVSDFVFYTEAGIEVGVASTKAFTAQLVILARMAFGNHEFLMREFQNLPAICEEALDLNDEMKHLAQRIHTANSAIYLGRGSLYPISLEGALKLKEISYVHAEGFAAGEMKHGPIALIDDNIPVICLCPHNELFEKTASNIQVALARGKNIIIFTDSEGSKLLPSETTKIILPTIHSEFAPILYAIPLQLLAYNVALMRGTDVDKPRNLAKSVTVE
ncbi:MAG: glutamine--fructose-6-phosphate transaminase (isomerizing) [Holosporaceae bacterium]|jgi:glucosamine--fructose-6-phosphate aminotransferase (isomerizing)|nr:glutamine--fructose-6-phosphate transaminase (isomerizing) [Holosporaceae bacterium]